MKTKKILSIVVAVLLIVSSLPVQSLAAMIPTAGENIADFNLMVSDRFGSDEPIPNPFGGDPIPITNIQEYNALSMYLEIINQTTTGAEFVEMLDRPFVPDEDGRLDKVEAGQTIYLGLKVKPEALSSTYKGIVNYGAFVKFDSDVFEVADNSLINVAVVNHISKKNLGTSLSGEEITKYAGAYMLSSKASVSASEEEGKSLLGIVVENDGNKRYIPTENTWDVVVPLTVKETAATGDYTLEVVCLDGLSSSEAILGSVEPNTSSIAAAGTTMTINDTTYTDHFSSNDVTINVVDYSDVPTGTEEDYTGSVTNTANAPYVGIKQVQGAQKDSVYDYITFPAEETINETKGFRGGDTIVVYGDASGNTELGRTVLNAANMFDDASGWGKGTLEPGAAVNGKSFRLVDENNYGYIKDQSQIWIGRLEAGATDVKLDSLIPITITPETTLHYAGDAEAVNKDKPGTLKNPIEVNLGDTVGSVKEQLFIGDYATTFTVPVEQGSTKSTVEVTVDWNNLQAQTGYVTGEGDTATFSVHGVTKLFVPFPETVEDGITYTNPTEAVYWDTNAFKENKPVPQYGAAIYVKVNPVAADYYVRKPSEAGANAGIVGKTAEVLAAGDVVEFYTDNTEESEPFYAWELTGTAQDNKWTFTDFSDEGVAGEIPAPGSPIYLKVTQNSVQPAVTTDYIEVVVTNGTTATVAGDITVKGEGPEGEVVIGTNTTFAQIIDQISPLSFRLSGYVDEVPLNLTADKYTDVVVKADGTGGNLTTSVFDKPTDSEAVYTIEYEIPGDSAEVDGSSVTYTNPKSYKLTFSTISIDRVDIGNGDKDEEENYGLTVTADQNQPNGSRNDDTSGSPKDTKYWDLITITGDTKGEVEEGDTVYVYKANASESFTNGVVYEKTQSGEGAQTYTYKVKVKQLGRTPDYNDLRLTIGRDGTDTTYIASPKLKFSAAIPEEEYELQGFLPFDPEVIKIQGTYETLSEVYTAVKEGTVTLPASAVGTYARYSETEAGTLDDTTSVTKVFALNGTWGGSEELAPDGQNASTMTVTTADVLADQTEGTAAIVGKNAQETLTIKIQAVTDGYEDLPEGTVPPVDELVNSTESKIRNNAFPQTDKVTIADPVPTDGGETGPLTVYAYTSAENAAARLPVAKITLDRDGAADEAQIMALYDSSKVTFTDADNSVLNRNGGSLWFTVETEDTAPSAAVEKAYDVEDFTLLSTDIEPESMKAININLTQFKTAVDGGTDALDYVTARLPKSLTLTVGHVQRGADGVTLETVGDTHQVIMPVDAWYKSVESTVSKTPLTAEDLPTVGETNIPVYAVAEQEDLQDVTVVLTQDSEVSAKIPVYFGEQTGTYADRTDAYYYTSAQVTINGTNAAEMEIPEPAESHIKASTNNTVDKTDDSIVIDFKGLDPGMADKNVTITIPGEPGTTLEGTLDGNGQLTINKDTGLTQGTFTGFPENGTTITVVFDDGGENSSREVQITVEPVSGAYDLTSVVEPSAITIASGSVHKMQDLLTHVDGIEKTNAMSGEASIQGVPLVKTEAGQGANTVKWTLRKATGAEPVDWSKAEAVEGTDLAWETAFAAYDADAKFALTADITDSTAEDGNNITNSLNLVAAVPVTVYDINDPQSGSLKITQGNSDLYTYGAEPNEPAYKEIQKRNEANSTSLTNEAFYTDAIFYYYYDSYDGYTDGKAEPSDTAKVSDYTGQSAITEVAGLSGDELQTWLTENPDNWEVLQLDENGEPVSEKTYGADGSDTGTTNNIDPRNSLDKSKYVVPNVSYERLEEDYIIRYVVEYNGQVYTADRRVKLTYKPGDVNFDQLITQADSVYVINIYGSGGRDVNVFKPTEEDKLDPEKVAELDALNLKITDINSDALTTQADGVNLVNIYANPSLMPNLRW